MTTDADLRFHTLHVVRIRGRATTDSVADGLGHTVSAVAALLQLAAEAGHVIHRDGRAAGWSLTPDGRTVHAELLAAERTSCAALDEISAAYEDFLVLNGEVKTLCTEWQLKPDGSLNDHTDATHDTRVIAALGDVDGRVQPVCGQLAAALGRFSTYAPRLGRAIERVRGGDIAWFTSPAIDSYHTVWFELHEDLIQTLGVARHE